jgi:erythronate-4-phosphate dehydrogenase
MKIVADKDIPFLEGVFEPYADVVYIKGDQIVREDLLDADVLIVRTRTQCNADLLEGTSVKMVTTATIGTDHIDLEYCRANGIEVANAAGCNAGGVMQYVFSAVYGVAARKGIKLDEATFGIIGAGNVGTKVEELARYLGFNVLRCDPPRAAAEGEEGFCSLEHLLENSHIVTMHVPLDETTRGMADETFFALMKPGAIFINSARG